MISAAVLAALVSAGCGEIEPGSVPSAAQRSALPPAPAQAVSPGSARIANGDPDTLLGFRPSRGDAITPEVAEEDDPTAIELALDDVLYESDPETRRVLLEWVRPAVAADARLEHRRDELEQVDAELAAAHAAESGGETGTTFLFDDQTAE
jgi:hypothetical protein